MTVLGAFRTATEAVEYVYNLFMTQIQRSVDERTLPNASTNGDAAARVAFLTLLEPLDQRALFLRLLRDSRVFPRIRTLIGSPPFSFLRPEDDTLLRAAGITHGRVHMAHAEPTTTSTSEFSKGHFEDAAGRCYKVVARRERRDTPPFQFLTAGETVLVDVRLPKRTTKNKMSIISKRDNASEMISLVFPRPGETLNMQRVASLRVPLSAGGVDPNEIRVNVQGGKQREVGSPIARLLVNVL